jgi:inner membrane protein
MKAKSGLAGAVRRHSVVAKVLLIGILSLLLLVPLLMLQSVVSEREQRKAETESEIMQSWGGPQTLAGPFLTVPYVSRSRDANGKPVETMQGAHFLPQTLAIDGSLLPETRSRGMYHVTVYGARLSLQGAFSRPDFSGIRVSPGDILWDQAFVSLELPDMRSIQEKVPLIWGPGGLEFRSGKGSIGLFAGEMRAEVPVLAPGKSGRSPAVDIPFSFELSLHGGDSISFLPLGDETRVHVRSTWASPNFNGSYLPVRRALGSDGFDAEWRVISMARPYPQRWTDGEVEPQALAASAFGVSLMTPVDTYQKVTRALKYGLLFLVLPFCTLFFFEVFSRRRVHALQYLLVGLADCVFYLLLLSLAEHVSFATAYAIAAGACTGLVTLYVIAVVKSGTGVVMLPVLGAAYGFLALVLSSEDNALMLGAVGLFFLLGTVMFLTRKVDWYRSERDESSTLPT